MSCLARENAVFFEVLIGSKRVAFALDSQSALKVVLRQSHRCHRFCFLLDLVARTQAALTHLATLQVQFIFAWVLSHGKASQVAATCLLVC